MNDTENQTTERPVYLLGETLLSIYLAFRLASAGENPVIVTPPKTNRPDKVDITIKDAQTLKKHTFTYHTAAYTFSPGKMLLITSPSISFKSELMLLSPRSLAASPIVIFSPLHDISVAETLLGKSLIRGCFDGWLQNGNQTVSVLGDTPRISLVKNYTGLEACLASLSLLHRTGLECQTTENGPQAFWEHFAVQALGSILSAYYQQNIFNIAKNKEKQREIGVLAAELSALARSEGAELKPENIVSALLNIPLHYSFPAQSLDSAAVSELNRYYRTLINLASAAKLHLPGLNRLMKEIYFRINSF